MHKPRDHTLTIIIRTLYRIIVPAITLIKLFRDLFTSGVGTGRG